MASATRRSGRRRLGLGRGAPRWPRAARRSSSPSRSSSATVRPVLQHHHAVARPRAAPRAPRRSSGSPSPRARGASTRRWISCLAPTSMPRVGSSRISSVGSVASQRASSTFCWLPPESSRIGCSMPAHLMPSELDEVSTSARSAPGGTRRARQARQQREGQVLAHRELRHDAVDLPVLGAEADAGARWRPGLGEVGDAPRPDAQRAAGRRLEAEQRARRRLGAPRAEQARRARRSRRGARRATRRAGSAVRQRLDLEHGARRGPGRRACRAPGASDGPGDPGAEKPVAPRERTSSGSRPIIVETSPSRSAPAMSRASTVRPSRIDVTRSHTANSSSRKWET